jgi:hypothetical protein
LSCLSSFVDPLRTGELVLGFGTRFGSWVGEAASWAGGPRVDGAALTNIYQSQFLRRLLGSARALPSMVSLKDYVGGLGPFTLRLIPRPFPLVSL